MSTTIILGLLLFGIQWTLSVALTVWLYKVEKGLRRLEMEGVYKNEVKYNEIGYKVIKQDEEETEE